VQVVPGNTTVPNVQRVSAVAEPQDVVDDRDQPLYVNAKQYHRILKRRQARAKLEAAGKIPKERRVPAAISVLLRCLCERKGDVNFNQFTGLNLIVADVLFI